MKWPTVNLFALCSPKQWPTISSKQLTAKGYPVYGANGQIGFYHSYNHEEPTILVTCRGATCGTVNISPPKSYVTGNAMALDNPRASLIEFRFLYYALQIRGLKDTITGAAQPQITRANLSKVEILLPSISEQRRIVEIMDQADELRKKRAEADAKAARILPALFYKMFGDPATNTDQAFQALADFAEIFMGQSPPGKTYNREGDGLPFFQGKMEFGSVNPIVRQWCSSPSRIAEPGDVLLCVRAPVGPTNIADTKCAIGRGLAIIRPIPGKSTTEFLFYSLRAIENVVAKVAQGSTFTAIRRQDVEKIRVPKAGMKDQSAFSVRAKTFQGLRDQGTRLTRNIEKLFAVLLHLAFTGNLTAKWREAHMKELLAEMEQQAKALNLRVKL